MNLIKSLLIITLFSLQLFSSEKLSLHFFGSSTCGECFELKSEILLPLQSKHSDSLEITFHDIDQSDGLATLLSYEEKYKIEQGSAQELFSH